MQGLTVNKVRVIIDSEKEIEDPQSLTLLALIAMGNAKSRILKNGNVRGVKEHAISQIEGSGILEEFRRAFSKNAPKIEKGGRSNW